MAEDLFPREYLFNPLMPKVELMRQILTNLEFLLVVDPKTIFFWFYMKKIRSN